MKISNADALAPRQSIAEVIADQLRMEIISARIGPDEPIKQDHVARRFNVSHAPVREALRQLASEALVIYEVNRGIKTAPLDRAEAEETGDLRLQLELSLIKPAVRHFSEDDHHKALQAIAVLADTDDIATQLSANSEFHEAIYRPAQQPVTLKLVSQLRSRYARYLGFMWQNNAHAPVSLTEHRELLDLIARGKAREAAVLLKAHIRATTNEIMMALDNHNSSEKS